MLNVAVFDVGIVDQISFDAESTALRMQFSPVFYYLIKCGISYSKRKIISCVIVSGMVY